MAGQDHTLDESSDGTLSLERIFHALSDPVRLGIVRQLYRAGECSCAALDGGRPKSTMSHQFRVLREAGLIRTRNQGVTHMNSLRRHALDAAFPGLLAVVVAGDDQPGLDAVSVEMGSGARGPSGRRAEP